MTIPTHVDGYIHAQETHEPGVYTFSVWGCDMSTCGYIPVAKAVIPLPEITHEQIKSRHLVLLRLKREEVYQEAAKKAAELDEQISKLESLTYNLTPQELAE